jgi:hypothetical protein
MLWKTLLWMPRWPHINDFFENLNYRCQNLTDPLKNIILGKESFYRL